MQERKKPAQYDPKLEYKLYWAWKNSFRDAAISDNYALFRDHMLRLGLPNKPKLMLEGTTRVIRAISDWFIWFKMPSNQFLNMQRYVPSEAPDARYIFTFDLCGKAFARVMVNNIQNQPPDLADLYAHTYYYEHKENLLYAYERVGYHYFWISHPDWSPLTSEELKQLENDVTEDLLYDFDEDELNYRFDGSTDPCYLFISVHDR